MKLILNPSTVPHQMRDGLRGVGGQTIFSTDFPQHPNKQEGTELLTFWSTSFSVEEREHMALSSTPIGKCSSHAAPYTDLLFRVPEPS